MRTLAFILLVCFSSCEVLKSKRSAQTDSISIRKVDSTVTHKFEVTAKQDSTWWREIINFRQDPKDTTIVLRPNYYNSSPIQIIREGGSFSREDMLRIADSTSRAQRDTTRVTTATEEKGKETKVMTQWYIWAIIVLGALVALQFAGKYFTIIKK